MRGNDMYTVMAFYPNLGDKCKVRVTAYKKSEQQMFFDYINHGLRMCETPFVALDGNKVIMIEEFGMTREQMAELIERLDEATKGENNDRHGEE